MRKTRLETLERSLRIGFYWLRILQWFAEQIHITVFTGGYSQIDSCTKHRKKTRPAITECDGLSNPEQDSASSPL